MTLMIFFIVLYRIIPEYYIILISRPAGAAIAAVVPNTAAGIIAGFLCPDTIQRVTSRFKRLLTHTLIFIRFDIKIDFRGVLTCHKGIYNNCIMSGMTANHTHGTGSHSDSRHLCKVSDNMPTAISSGIEFYTTKCRFSKKLGCVCHFSKNQKI